MILKHLPTNLCYEHQDMFPKAIHTADNDKRLSVVVWIIWILKGGLLCHIL